MDVGNVPEMPEYDKKVAKTKTILTNTEPTTPFP